MNPVMLQDITKPKPIPFMHRQRARLRKAKEAIGVFFWSYGRYLKDRYGTFDYDLLDAADHGHVAELRAMLKKGANVNARDSNGNTPLILAVLEGHYAHIECCKILIEHGADPFMKNKQGKNAMMLARRAKDSNMARLFTEYWLNITLGKLKDVFGKDSKAFFDKMIECAGSK